MPKHCMWQPQQLDQRGVCWLRRRQVESSKCGQRSILLLRPEGSELSSVHFYIFFGVVPNMQVSITCILGLVMCHFKWGQNWTTFETKPNKWRARCKNGLSDDFGPSFTKPPNYLLSCNVTVAKWIVSCSQHIVLVIWIEFSPKLYQVTLPLARKVELPKCQEIPIISTGGKIQFCWHCPWWMWLLKKKSQTRLAAMDYLDRKKVFQKLFTLQNGKFCFTGNSQLSHLFRLAAPSLPGSTS